MSAEEDHKQQINLLLEEWKQNVALYIDQDKRTFVRVQVYLAIHAALLIIFRYFDNPIVQILLAVMAIYITFITQMMHRRGHSFIILRRVQGMLIEDKLKRLCINKNWLKSCGLLLTTFSREHLIFLDRNKLTQDTNNNDLLSKWDALRNEIKYLGTYVEDFFFSPKKLSISHLKWQELMFYGLYVLWLALIIFVLLENHSHLLKYWNIIEKKLLYFF